METPARTYEFAREIALRLLTTRARSAKELRDALAAKGVPDKITDEVLERFGDVGLVNDASFAQAWVESGQRRLRSRRGIAQELGRKGIDKETAGEALAAVDDEAELAAARELAGKRLRSMASQPREVARRRLAGVLARRGFSAGVVTCVVSETTGATEWASDNEFD
ncbi:MAG: regulatory protein RecX [Propionibacteriaceae bacterium]|nr:regulatory protein RecX [Micropruina sp.]